MYRRKEMWTRGPDWELVYHRLKYWSASLSDFNVPPSVKKSWTYMKGNFLHAAGGLCFWSHSCPLNCPNCPNLVSKCLHLHVKYFPWSRRYTGHKYTLYLPSSSTTNKKFSFPSLFGPPLNSWAEKQSREEKSIFLEETWPLGPDYQAMTSVRFYFQFSLSLKIYRTHRKWSRWTFFLPILGWMKMPRLYTPLCHNSGSNPYSVVGSADVTQWHVYRQEYHI